MYIIFTLTDTATESGVLRGDGGYTTIPYSTDNEAERIIETSKPDLVALFEQAQANSGTLDGADETFAAAIADPLAYLDFIVYDETDGLAFDTEYSRPSPSETV